MCLALLGCALLYGQLGLVSLCQWALVGVGGWISLRVYHSIHPPFFVTILAGGVGASAIGMIWGLPALTHARALSGARHADAGGRLSGLVHRHQLSGRRTRHSSARSAPAATTA